MPTLQEIVKYYAGLSDASLIAAYRVGRGSYEPAAWDVVNHEMERRGLSSVTESPVAAPNTPFADAERDSELAASRREIQRGAWTFGIGLAVTILTYASATNGGGTYVVAYGAIIMGLIRLVRGNARRERAIGIDPVTGRQRE